MKFSIERNDALNFLQEHPLGTLATTNEKGTPELAAVYFFTEKNFTCYFVTKAHTRKLKNIEIHPDASLLSYDEELLYSVEVSGEATIVRDPLEIAQAIERFQEIASARHAQYWIPPISQLQAGQYIVCKLLPSEVHIYSYATDLQSSDLPQHLSFTP